MSNNDLFVQFGFPKENSSFDPEINGVDGEIFVDSDKGTIHFGKKLIGTNVGKKTNKGEIFNDPNNRADGLHSHAEGSFTEAKNNCEHAQGRYNKSNTGTIHSVGIGTHDTDRKNAHEITNDGKHYIYGIGEYDGTNTVSAKDLKSVLDGKADIVFLNMPASKTLTEKQIEEYRNTIQSVIDNGNKLLITYDEVSRGCYGPVEVAYENKSDAYLLTHLYVKSNSIYRIQYQFTSNLYTRSVNKLLNYEGDGTQVLTDKGYVPIDWIHESDWEAASEEGGYIKSKTHWVNALPISQMVATNAYNITYTDDTQTMYESISFAPTPKVYDSHYHILQYMGGESQYDEQYVSYLNGGSWISYDVPTNDKAGNVSYWCKVKVESIGIQNDEEYVVCTLFDFRNKTKEDIDKELSTLYLNTYDIPIINRLPDFYLSQRIARTTELLKLERRIAELEEIIKQITIKEE